MISGVHSANFNDFCTHRLGPSCGHCIGFGTADEDGWCPTAPVVSYESTRTHANLIGRRGHE